jgi:hypothetical protein
MMVRPLMRRNLLVTHKWGAKEASDGSALRQRTHWLFLEQRLGGTLAD